MYRDLNDYEVISLIKENDEINYEIIYKKYKPLVYKLACKYKNICKKFGCEIDDLMQIGYMALFKAIETFRSDESMFYTYLIHVVENAFLQEIRKNNTHKRRTLNECFSYDVLVPNTDKTYLEIIPDLNSEYNLENLDSEYHYIVFKNTLPFDVACVFELLFNGYTNDEIMILLNMKKQKINECFTIIKKQLLYV